MPLVYDRSIGCRGRKTAAERMEKLGPSRTYLVSGSTGQMLHGRHHQVNRHALYNPLVSCTNTVPLRPCLLPVNRFRSLPFFSSYSRFLMIKEFLLGFDYGAFALTLGFTQVPSCRFKVSQIRWIALARNRNTCDRSSASIVLAFQLH